MQAANLTHRRPDPRAPPPDIRSSIANLQPPSVRPSSGLAHLRRRDGRNKLENVSGRPGCYHAVSLGNSLAAVVPTSLQRSPCNEVDEARGQCSSGQRPVGGSPACRSLLGARSCGPSVIVLLVSPLLTGCITCCAGFVPQGGDRGVAPARQERDGLANLTRWLFDPVLPTQSVTARCRRICFFVFLPS